MYGLLIALHLIICAGLIISVLLQSSKGEGLAGAFGGSSLTGTVFGGRGAATFLSRATTVLAISFFASALILTFMNPASTASTGQLPGQSAVQEAAQSAPAPAEVPDQTPASGTETQTPPVQIVEPGSQQAQPAATTGDSGK